MKLAVNVAPSNTSLGYNYKLCEQLGQLNKAQCLVCQQLVKEVQGPDRYTVGVGLFLYVSL